MRVRGRVRVVTLLAGDSAHADRVPVRDKHRKVAVDGAQAQVGELTLQARVQHLGARMLLCTAQGFKYSRALF